MTTDFVRDKNPTAIYKVAMEAGNDLPDYVADYEIPEDADLDALADTAFADPFNRLHPIHSKAASVLSGAYLAGKGLRESLEFQRAKKAAEFFGAKEDFDKLTSILVNQEKKAGEGRKEEYALSFQLEDGGEIKHFYPINNEVQVVKAAVSSDSDWTSGRLPIDWYRGAAIKIVKKANELGLDKNSLPERVWNMGEERLPNLENAKVALVSRKRAGVNEEGLKLYEDVIKSAATADSSVSDCVDLWLDLDAVHGVDYRSVTNPYAAFYSGPKISDVEKQAAEVIFIEDVPVPKTEVVGLLVDDALTIKREFNKAAAEKVEEALAPLKEEYSEKSAAIATARIASLPESSRKGILRILLKNNK